MLGPTHQMTLNHIPHVANAATQLVAAANLTQYCHNNEDASVPAVMLCNVGDVLMFQWNPLLSV